MDSRNNIDIVQEEPQPLNNVEDFYDENEESYYVPKSRLKKQSFLIMILPHFCLFGFLYLYILIGAVYFHYHESAFEVESKTQELSNFVTFRNNFYDEVSNLKHSKLSQEDFANAQKELIGNLISKTLQLNRYITKEDLLLNGNETSKELFWSFSNSIFFATTVVTTIGYSNKLSPETFWGKFGCIIFAIFGIPILLVTTADCGKFLCEFMSWFYKKFKEWKKKIFFKINGINPSTIKQEYGCDELRIPVSFLLFLVIIYLTISGFFLKFWRGWSFFDAFYVCFTTITTIGTDNKNPSKNDCGFLIIIYFIITLSLGGMLTDLAGTEFLWKIHCLWKNAGRFFVYLKERMMYLRYVYFRYRMMHLIGKNVEEVTVYSNIHVEQ